MTLPAPTYDLVLLLDPQAEEAARAKILADARAAIEAQGEFLRQDDWGDRALDLPDRSQSRRRVPPAAVPRRDTAAAGALDRTLRITDGIMRFRIIKLKPGVPDAPDVLAAPTEEPQSEPQAVAEAAAVRRGEPSAATRDGRGRGGGASRSLDSEVGEPA